MQPNAALNSLSLQTFRRLAYRVSAAFEKEFDDDIDFFTIGVSAIGGGDFIPGEGGVVQEWDRYLYTDYSDRVIRMEWSREEDPYSSVVSAMADVVFANEDDYFKSGGDSPLADYIIPGRPFRLYAGFGDQLVQVFVGVTEKVPAVDEGAKTVTFHCIDFLSSILKKPADESLVMQNKRTDEILAQLLEDAGLLSTQYELDPGFNTIEFFYVPPSATVGALVADLMEAEQGRFFMDETGVIKFKNRQNFESSSVYDFGTTSNILDLKKRREDEIINIVNVTSNKLEVFPEGSIWTNPTSYLLEPGKTIEVWANFNDPVLSVTSPTYAASGTSKFNVNEAADGSGAANATAVTLDSIETFAKAAKMTFTSTSTINLYLVDMELYGQAAKVVQPISLQLINQDSIDQYDPKPKDIDNPYLQNLTDATSKAAILLNDYSEYGVIQEIDGLGSPALQLGDVITIDNFGDVDTYRITKIISKMQGNPARFMQIIRVKKFVNTTYFTIEQSIIEGDDVIAP